MTNLPVRQPDACQTPPAPFPLTELQHAYWLGEQPAYRLHTPAFLHRCFFAETLDVPLLESAILAVVQSQPSLTVEILPDGTQRPLLPPAQIALPVNDFCHVTVDLAKAYLAERKTTLESELPPFGHGLQFACLVDQVADGYYVHFLFRLIAFDAMSMWLFLNDMCSVYLGRSAPQPQAAKFADFVQQRHELMRSPGYQKSLEYWQERVKELPNAPELPLVDHEAIPEKSTFRRIRISLNARQVEALHAQARRCGVSINSLLCTMYADVLRLWSKNTSFIINMLVSHRPSGDDRFAHVFGNFGSTMPVEAVDVEGGLRERARALQRKMFRDLKHMQVSGVEVIRAMGRSGSVVPAMPVVFASSLGLPMGELLSPVDLGWELRAGGLQTPQVLLDCQVYMDGDQLTLNWDYVVEAFQPGVVEDMFKSFGDQLMGLIDDTTLDTPQLPFVPARNLAARQAANASEKPLPTGLLHDFFAAACRQHAERPAIISDARTLSYDALWCLTTRLAAQLREHAVGRNDLVAIVARRGWRQVSAAMATVQAGGAYLPVSSELPAERKAWLIGQEGVKVALVERALADGFELPAGVTMLILEDVLPDGEPGPAVALQSVQGELDLAYVIFTSGSTGQPKGVMIDHRGAVNTIQDIIDRFGLTPEDRVIGISAFNFDLSVYDIFGSLGTGAALVLPPYSETPSPDDWARMVREHEVSVWNTVPALLEMQIEYLGARAASDLASLRLVMLSGDWIPVSLPGRLAAQLPDTVLIGMGGATEASIWSNYFVIDRVDPSWKSIPYGWPLANQSFHVLTRDLRHAPTGVPGELYIGGIGVAKGYYNDPGRTAASFITHPQTGERLYRTGDMGRYHESGYLEFLGRNDDQVKIRGFRIELGEIDAVLDRCPGVRSAATIVRQGNSQDRQLVTLYVPENDSVGEAALREHLARTLPDYMVPAQFIELEQIPVTANGKVNRKALADIAAALPPAAREKRTPRTADEQRLAGIWQTLLNIDEPGIDDNFFEQGGTSLLAVRLLNAIASEFGRSLPLASLLRHGTIASQAALLAEGETQPATRSPLEVLRDGSDSALVVVHPVGGNVLCYRELTGLVPEGMAVLALQSPGDGAEREVGELATRYIEALSGHLGGCPLHLLGWSMGGVIAQEMARQLEAAGIAPLGLTLIDSWQSADNRATVRLEGYAALHNFVRDLLGSTPMPDTFAAIEALDANRQPEAALAVLREAGVAGGQMSAQEFVALLAEYQANYNALVRHAPQPVSTPTRLFRATRSQRFPLLAGFAVPDGGHVEQVAMDEDHFSIFQGEALRSIVAQALRQDAEAEHALADAPAR
ncbi:amino acid adenylation domain-containing protein [Crenobacter sp. SG2305]|uniref:non-ribosomal peptide synthetase n=1 Tax=Crenobacter oryzisoli TaxID=3056844 RepID=UPI0025AB5351|nr:amino acid adenylation domain-containing protein [Crenobacter sp. SG2305]MDN0085399.1 amino acid adenylation domain-containing protein [Crenobacter sp. SG2305]